MLLLSLLLQRRLFCQVFHFLFFLLLCLLLFFDLLLLLSPGDEGFVGLLLVFLVELRFLFLFVCFLYLSGLHRCFFLVESLLVMLLSFLYPLQFLILLILNTLALVLFKHSLCIFKKRLLLILILRPLFIGNRRVRLFHASFF